MGMQRIHASKAPCGSSTVAVQRLAEGRAFQSARTEVAQVHPGVLRPSSGGQPLSPTVQAKMEAAFGHDFANVRIHHGGEAESIGAAAFTRGTHIHFGPGFYQPHTPAGQLLLGHELAHVVQQRAGRVHAPAGRAVPINDDAHLEREADALGSRAARGEPVGAGSADIPIAGTGIGPIQPVWVSLKDGKAQYDWLRDKNDPPQGGNEWVWMEKDEFTAWKNAGKRQPSQKWTDPVLGKSYLSSDGIDFREYKNKKPSLLSEKLDKTKLWNRSRPDRTKNQIGLYDVAPYKKAKSWETSGDKMEHDHVVAGESRKRSYHMLQNGGYQIADPTFNTDFLKKYISSKDAYNNALSIEIRGKGHPEGNDHMDYSPTWGSRQQNEDTAKWANGKTYKAQRPAMDAQLPGVAFHRDVDTMLSKTSHHNDGLEQAGAYRFLYKTSVKEKVLNPLSQAFDIQGDPLAYKNSGGGLTYTSTSKMQGPRTDAMLMEHTAKRLGKSPMSLPWSQGSASNTTLGQSNLTLFPSQGQSNGTSFSSSNQGYNLNLGYNLNQGYNPNQGSNLNLATLSPAQISLLMQLFK